MKIVIFEDERFAQLRPLTYLRPVFELRCGALTLRRKVQEKFPDCELHLETRPELADLAADLYGTGAANNEERLAPDDDALLVNGAAVLGGAPDDYRAGQRVGLSPEGEFVWAHLSAGALREFRASSARELSQLVVSRFPTMETEDRLIRRPWHLVSENAAQIGADFQAAYGQRLSVEPGEGVAVWGDRSNLHVADDVELQPWSFIDCRGGPVIIESGVVVGSGSAVEGPSFIGREAQLLGAQVRPGSSIGPLCVIGGEVEQSVLHGYVNLRQGGFVGHSYVGEWVNLGAFTATSDLRNNYGTVWASIDGRLVETGLLKLGAFIGDHTKTSTGTRLNAGAVLGIMCNVVSGGDLLPRSVPSFGQYLFGRLRRGTALGQALESARRAMGRRGMELTAPMTELIKRTEVDTREARLHAARKINAGRSPH